MKDAKKNELKKQYEHKFEAEKEKLDTYLKNTLADFEGREKAKKDIGVSKSHQQELRVQKDKHKTIAFKEKEELKQSLDRRLDNFKAILKEKLDAHKEVTLVKWLNLIFLE